MDGTNGVLRCAREHEKFDPLTGTYLTPSGTYKFWPVSIFFESQFFRADRETGLLEFPIADI